ncbi:MAG: EAL domain-containing protein [Nitrospirales bacterium]|nr:EAL domain-containing protein [Nitrospirales bacterium]
MAQSDPTLLNVLLVDDDLDDGTLILEMIKDGLGTQFTFTQATSLREAFTLFQQSTFDILLLDLDLPQSLGLDTLRQLRQAHPSSAILILSGLEDEALAVQAVQNGAQDYLIKGQVNSHALSRAIRYAVERHRVHEQVTYQAHYDHLTGLANRGLFHERLHYALARCNRNDTAIALLFLDLDQFKAINDTFGHAYGDMVLKTVASRLKKCIREVDTGVRMGGDEFAILLDEISSVENVGMIAQRLIDLVSQPMMVQDHELHVTCSIGATIYPWDCAKAQDLLKHSDTAMYRAKAQGGNNFQFYTAGMQNSPLDGNTIDVELRRALTKGEFLLHYQPQLDLRTRQIIGMEALLRWQHPYQGMIGPMDFIPKAEESGLIVPIGEWVLHTASAQLKKWESEGLPISPVSVNLSARQVHKRSLPAAIESILQETQLDPQFLRVELTESFLINESPSTLSTLQELKAMGVRIYIDDFGVGYASLRYLKAFPLDGLKLDQSLIHDINTDTNNAAIVRAIIALSNTLGLTIIAEGVETESQADLLAEFGCDIIQGYWVTPPMPAHESCHWLSKTLQVNMA